jgi:hypothetical protein
VFSNPVASATRTQEKPMKTFTLPTLPALSPRNPVAPAARARHAGVHGPGAGARRQQARRALHREISAHLRPDPHRTP